jgi:hypothetical protein
MTVQASRVTDQDNVDVAQLLAADDHHYLVQRETGNEALMEFAIPDSFHTSGSIFLHSKGYYHRVVSENGESEFAFIWPFLKPGRLSEYSYENYLKLRDLLAEN